ncbi:MAG: hypothetical protein ABR592_08085 [Nitriliruptorales bacterium]
MSPGPVGGNAVAPSTRWLSGTVALVLVVSIVAIVVATVREPPALPPGSPEAVVQRYLRAVAEGDSASLRDTYTPQLRERCEREEPRRRPPFSEERLTFEADLLGTRQIDDETVEVRVRITEFYGEPPLGGGGYDHREVFVVERVDATWGIAEMFWPYDVCPA